MLNIKSYDIFVTNDNSDSSVYTGCISRRYLSATIDTILSLAVLLVFGIEGYSSIAGVVNLCFILCLLLLPEILWRQSIGMFVCNIVVIVPPNQKPIQSLLIRKFINLIEFVLPSPIYYYLVSLSKRHESLSDRASSCIIARKRYLYERPAKEPNLTNFSKIVTPLLFIIWPIIVLTATAFILLSFMNTETFWQYLINFFEVSIEEKKTA